MNHVHHPTTKELRAEASALRSASVVVRTRTPLAYPLSCEETWERGVLAAVADAISLNGMDAVIRASATRGVPQDEVRGVVARLVRAGRIARRVRGTSIIYGYLSPRQRRCST